MEISVLFEGVDFIGSLPKGDVKEAYCDSRQCTAGSLFVAVRGAEADGHTFIGKAIEKGAAYIVCEEIPAECANAEGVQFILVKESRKAVARIAANFHNNPSKKLRVVEPTEKHPLQHCSTTCSQNLVTVAVCSLQ